MIKVIHIRNIKLLLLETILVTLLVSLVSSAKANAAITSQLSYGASGSQVTELQQFLATNYYIYPQGIVSGYFGNLTRAAVIQFQVAYDIPQTGTVGPITRTKINEIMASGLGLDINAAVISDLSVSTGRTSATIHWSTNERTHGQVFYDVTPLVSYEATHHAEIPYISGNLVEGNSSALSQSINLSGLQSNTLYYYIVRSIDPSGNVTMSTLQTFRTD